MRDFANGTPSFILQLIEPGRFVNDFVVIILKMRIVPSTHDTNGSEISSDPHLLLPFLSVAQSSCSEQAEPSVLGAAFPLIFFAAIPSCSLHCGKVCPGTGPDCVSPSKVEGFPAQTIVHRPGRREFDCREHRSRRCLEQRHSWQVAFPHVGVGPVALRAQVHLVTAAHHATGDEVHAGADEVCVFVRRVVAIEDVETQIVLAFDELLFLRGPAPVD